MIIRQLLKYKIPSFSILSYPKLFTTKMSSDSTPVFPDGDGKTSYIVRELQSTPYDEHSHRPIEVVPGGSYYNLLISSVVPRPVAFVSTRSLSGINNLAPFSYFSAVSHDPPTISVGICTPRNGGKKDSWRNIEETGEFVVNIISDWMVESANYTSGEFPYEVDEMILSGLTPVPSIKVKPNRVKQSAVQMECKTSYVHHIYNDAGDHTSAVVFGRVVMFHVVEPLIQTNARGLPVVDPDGLHPISRLGGDTWATVGSHFDLPRPVIKK